MKHFFVLAIMFVGAATSVLLSQVNKKYDIVSAIDVASPWQKRVTSLDAGCTGRPIRLITSSGGVWTLVNDSTYEFISQVYPAHDLSAIDDATGDIAVYVDGLIITWSSGSPSDTLTVPDVRCTDIHFSQGQIVLVGTESLIVVNVDANQTLNIYVDVDAGVKFSGRTMAYARNDSVYTFDLIDRTEEFVSTLGSHKIVGLRDDVVGLHAIDSIIILNSAGMRTSIALPSTHRKISALWDDSTMIVLGTDTTVISRLYQINLASQQALSLGIVEGYENTVAWYRSCNELYIASTPVGIRKYTLSASARYALSYSYSNVNTALLAIALGVSNEPSFVSVADAPTMPARDNKVYTVASLDTADVGGTTRVFATLLQGEYTQVVLCDDSQCKYLVTNKRVLVIDSLDKSIWSSNEIITCACLTADAVIVANLQGVYRIDRKDGDVDTLCTVDTDMYVPIHLSSDSSSGLILAVESNASKTPKRRHRVIEGKKSTLLDVPMAERYSASYVSGDSVVLTGLQSVGVDRVTHVQRGSLHGSSYIIADSIVIPFPVSEQIQTPERIYCIGAAFKSVTLQFGGDIYHVYDMSGSTTYTSVFSAASRICAASQFFGANFPYAPRLIRVSLDTTVSSVFGATSDESLRGNKLAITNNGASLCLYAEGVQVEGRVSLYTINGEMVAASQDGCLCLTDYDGLAIGLLLAIGEHNGDHCVARVLIH